MSYAEIHARHVRQCILRMLADSGGYKANETLLDAALDGRGLSVTRDQVRGHLAWLSEQTLVTLRVVGELMIVTATQRGLDVAAGETQHPGVERPAPRAL
jgi:hypothetical protein